MTNFYRLCLFLIYFALCAAGMILGYYWGIGGSILGIVIGGITGTMVAMALNTPEKMENAFYTIVVIVLIAVVIYLIIAYWGDKPW